VCLGRDQGAGLQVETVWSVTGSNSNKKRIHEDYNLLILSRKKCREPLIIPVQTGTEIGVHTSHFAKQFLCVYELKFNGKSVYLKEAWKSGIHQTGFTNEEL